MTRTAGAIDPASGTLLTEVQVPNPDGALLSGSYVTVHFKLHRANPPLLIPRAPLLVDAQGVRVAVIEPDGTLHYRPIEIGRDYGIEVEVLSGLDAVGRHRHRAARRPRRRQPRSRCASPERRGAERRATMSP